METSRASTHVDIPEHDQVHVWTASVKLAAGLSDLASVINSAEQTQARKFRFEQHRVRYIFSQATLRRILSRYLHVRPQEIVFDFNEFGKPFLPKSSEKAALRFNMSHSEGLVVVAVAMNRHIGVDVERIRAIDDINAIARDYFAMQERTLLESAPPGRKEEAFYMCWTRKEAYIKAVGMGLSIPLNSFDASIPEGMPGRRLQATESSLGVEQWWLSDLTMPDRYVGALAIEGTPPTIRYVT
jgi:4'-phosphopantetheinyl transferase